VPATWDETWNRIDGLPVPIATTLDDAVALLGVSLAAVELAARHVEPYLCGDGVTRKWSLGELAGQLGLAEQDRKGRRLGRRTGDRDGGRGRRHSRRGAAATAAQRAAAELAEPEPEPAAVEDLADLDAEPVEDLPAAAGE
jgi:hypothetical protein